jgi:hypothetical protein
MSATDTLDADGLVKKTPSLIYTYGGGTFDPINPNPDEVDLEVVAHHLSNQCRWTGAVTRFYSVAEHCVLASMITPTLKCLLHDASEAYLSDIARPVKRSPEFSAYMVIEDRLEKAIAEHFGLEMPMLSDGVKYADEAMLWQEAKTLVPHLGELMPDPPPETPTIWCWTPPQAKEFFLQRFKELS